MPGRKRFLRFAAPCASIRLFHRLITAEEFAAIEWYACHPLEDPPVELLENCFPNAVAGAVKHAEDSGLPLWSDENIAAYWHTHKGEGSLCAVHRATIYEVLDQKGKAIAFLSNGIRLEVSNPYGLPLHRDCVVYAHRLTAIEIA
jgi:hypothetical protein